MPIDLINGCDDRIVPARMAPDFARTARERGDAVTLHDVRDTGHVELIAPGTSAWRAVTETLDRVWRREDPVA